MNKERIAGPISATLRRNGFAPIASGTSGFSEGVRVYATPFGASIEASHLDEDAASSAIADAAKVIAEAGYVVSRYGTRRLNVAR